MFSSEQNKKPAGEAPDKPTDKHEKKSTESSRKSNAFYICLEGVRELSDILQDFTDLIPAVGLNPALKTLSTIIGAIQDAKDNKEALKDHLLPRIERIRDQIVTPLSKDGNTAEGVRQTANSVGSRLAAALAKVSEKVEDMGKQGPIVKFIYHKANKEGIQNFGKQLDGILSEFTLEKINQLAASAQEQLEIVKDTRKIILDKAQRDLINGLPHVDAFYKSMKRAGKTGCDPNTRLTVLGRIEKWAESPDVGEPKVYWLCGLAGTGKSTICHTIAKWLAEESSANLGANYFFSRGQADVANAFSFFPTLAYQLSQLSPDFGQALAAALDKDQNAHKSNLESQCETLLSQPLSSLDNKGLSPLVIVVDALDECSQGVDTSVELLDRLIRTIRSSRTPVRLLISSRPESRIMEFFNSLEGDSAYKSLNLLENDVQKEVQDDIRLYMRRHFDKMRLSKRGLPRNWMTDQDIDKLVAYAIPLFAAAFIIVKFVNTSGKDPRKQIKILLDQSSSAKHVPYQHLDSVYLHVIASAYSEDGSNNDERDLLKLLLSTIVTLQVPMSPSTLARFLPIGDNDESNVLITLESVSSVLIIPESPEDPVRIFHTSFRDFITDASRCTDSFYYVQADETQNSLALQCLRILNTELTPDICGLGSAPYANADYPDINERLSQHLPQHLLYSCLYISAHVIASKDPGSDIIQGVETFSSEKLLMWIEVLGLSQQVDVLLSSLHSIGEWYNHAGSNPRVRNILSNASRFVSNFREAVETSTGEIYGPLLAIMPSCDMKDAYLKLPSAYRVRGLPIADKEWGSCRWAARLHTRSNFSSSRLAFSPDGRFLAGAREVDCEEHYSVWNAVSGTVAKDDGPLPPSKSPPAGLFSPMIPSMAFSSDNTELVCADMRDTKVWIYRFATSEDPRVRRVDTGDEGDKILLVAYAEGDDKSLVVVTSRGHINVWSANAGTGDAPRRICTPTLRGDCITLAAVSEDGCKLAIVRYGGILDVWDILSGRRISEEILRLECILEDEPRHLERSEGQQELRQMLFLAGGIHLAVYYTTVVRVNDSYLTSLSYHYLTTMKILEVETGHCLRSIHQDESCFLSYMSNAGGQLALLYTPALGPGQIHMYGENYTSYTVLAIPEDLHPADSPYDAPSIIAFSADQLVLAVGSAELVSVHDVNPLKEKYAEASNDYWSYLSHGPDGILYDVKVTQGEQRHMTVHIKGPHTDCNTTYSLRLQESSQLSLKGPFLIECNFRSVLMTDLRTGQPIFGFSIKRSPGGVIGEVVSVSADGCWMATSLRIWGGGQRVPFEEAAIWVHDLNNGAFVAKPWAPGFGLHNDIHLAADGRSFLATAYESNYQHGQVMSYAVWEIYPSNPLQVTRKGNMEHEKWRECPKNYEMASLSGNGIKKISPHAYTGGGDYVWAVIDSEDLSIKSYDVGGTSFLHSAPTKTSPRFLIVRSNRIEIQVGEVRRRLCWIPPKWSPSNWAWRASSWSGSELAFRTKDGELVRISTDELEESLYGSRLEWS